MARKCRAVICVGAHTKAPSDAACDFNNVSMLIGSDGRILGEQPKLVPLPFFYDGLPGRTQSVTPTEHGTVGTYICYDGLFTDIPRRAVDAGAEVLLVPSMDAESWPAQERCSTPIWPRSAPSSCAAVPCAPTAPASRRSSMRRAA